VLIKWAESFQFDSCKIIPSYGSYCHLAETTYDAWPYTATYVVPAY